MDFYLRCWIPSLKRYIKITELKMGQLDVLSKFVLNEDHEGTAEALENILKENLNNQTIFDKLDKFDKWFILCFLRAANISPTVYIQTTTVQNVPCNVELDLFNILTKLSEIEFSFETLIVDDLVFKFKVPTSLFTKVPGFEALLSIDDISITTPQPLLDSPSVYELVNTFLATQDKKYEAFYLIKRENETINISDVSLKLFDNTLYYFVRSIYLPFCKGQYSKKYKLLKHLGMTYNDINNITPTECDILLNQYAAEDAEKKAKKNTDTR